jgi:CrcB protein
VSLWLALLVGVGGAIGSLMRYGVGRFMMARLKPAFYGTLLVNLVGSLVIGGFIGLRLEHSYEAAYAFAAVGLLGGLTTYSTLNVQMASMINDGSKRILVCYIIATYVGGGLLTAVGVVLGYLLHT